MAPIVGADDKSLFNAGELLVSFGVSTVETARRRATTTLGIKFVNCQHSGFQELQRKFSSCCYLWLCHSLTKAKISLGYSVWPNEPQQNLVKNIPEMICRTSLERQC